MYMTFWKRQVNRDSKQISAARGWGGRRNEKRSREMSRLMEVAYALTAVVVT